MLKWMRHPGGMERLLTKALLALTVTLLPAISFADVMTFWQAVDTAQARNPQIQRAEALMRAARESNPKSMARLLPQVNVRAVDVLREGTHYANLRTVSHSDPRTVALSVDQRIFNAPSWIGYAQSDPHVEAAYADLMAMRQEIALRVATVTSNWLEAKGVYDLARRYIKITQHHLDENTLRLNAGESTETDVQQAASRAHQAQANLRDAVNTLEKETAFFREVVGANPDPDLALPELTWEEPNDLEVHIWKWIEDRPEIWAARARLQESSFGEQIERAAHLPTVDFNYTASHTWDAELGGSSGRSIKDDENAHSVSLVMNIPIFNGMETVSRTREAKAMKEAAMSELDRLRSLARRETEEARFDLKNNKAAIASLERALSFSEKAAAGLLESFHAGTRTMTDVLDSQFEVHTLRTNLVRHRYQAQLAVVRLWKALGRNLQSSTPARNGTHVESVRVTESGRDTMIQAVHEQMLADLGGGSLKESNEGMRLLFEELVADRSAPETTFGQQVRPLAELHQPMNERREENRIGGVLMIANRPDKAPPEAFPPLDDRGRYMVHVGTFIEAAPLGERVAALKAAGIPSWSERVLAPDRREMTRLLVGPFDTHRQLQAAMTIVNRRIGGSIGWVPVIDRGRESDELTREYSEALEELIR
ncbi:MAG: TolC family protein [Magnetococcus sp. YQC-9]